MTNSHPNENLAEAEPESLLCRIALERDSHAFDALSEMLREPLRRFLMARLDSDAAAVEDIRQETLLRVWTRAETWDGRGQAKAWIFRIAANLASNHRRTLSRRRERPLNLPEEAGEDDEGGEGNRIALSLWESAGDGPDTLAIRAMERDRVRRAVAELPEETRELLRLAHEDERGMGEIASALGIPEGTVKSRLYHTRKRLARTLASDET